MIDNKQQVVDFIEEVKSALTSFPTMEKVLHGSVTRWNADKGDYELRVENLGLTPGNVVFDVGSYTGDWANRMFVRYPGIKIVAFEPVEKYCEEFVDTNKGYDYELHRIGLSNESKELSIEDTGLSTSLESDGNLIVQIEDIRDHVKNFDKIDIMKMNIEGSEYECIEALIESGLINRVKSLVVQFHGTEKEVADSVSKWANIAVKISGTHNLEWSYPFIWERWTLRI